MSLLLRLLQAKYKACGVEFEALSYVAKKKVCTTLSVLPLTPAMVQSTCDSSCLEFYHTRRTRVFSRDRDGDTEDVVHRKLQMRYECTSILILIFLTVVSRRRATHVPFINLSGSALRSSASCRPSHTKKKKKKQPSGSIRLPLCMSLLAIVCICAWNS